MYWYWGRTVRSTFTIGLCDDESFVFDDLEQLVRQYGLSKEQNFNFVYFSSAEQLLHLQPCKTTALAEPSASVLMVPHPDILFLDIDMPGKFLDLFKQSTVHFASLISITIARPAEDRSFCKSSQIHSIENFPKRTFRHSQYDSNIDTSASYLPFRLN